jgi:NitT/TauT family transport system substrate-binding protein
MSRFPPGWRALAALSCIVAVAIAAAPGRAQTVAQGTAQRSAQETAQATKPPTPLKVVLNFTADGALGGFYHALARGYYAEAGLDVSFDFTNGSADAITRLASGLYDIGVGDIATLTEFVAKNHDTAPRAVFLLYNKSPAVIVAMKSSGIEKPSDLHGHVLGQGAADGASRMFPALAKLAGVDVGKIERKQITPRLRDSMLLTRQVDAVTGFDHTVWFNLKAAGTKFEDVNLIYYADYGLDVYGNAILASQKILQTDPDLVKRFVRASARGWREAIADRKPASRPCTASTRSPISTSRRSGSTGSAAACWSRPLRAAMASAPSTGRGSRKISSR